MPAQIGVTALYGLEAPEGAYVHESNKDATRRTVATQDENGVTVLLDSMPFEEQQVSIKGVGSADFSIAAASTAAAGSLQILEVSETQEVGKRPEFEIKGRKYVNDA